MGLIELLATWRKPGLAKISTMLDGRRQQGGSNWWISSAIPLRHDLVLHCICVCTCLLSFTRTGNTLAYLLRIEYLPVVIHNGRWSHDSITDSYHCYQNATFLKYNTGMYKRYTNYIITLVEKGEASLIVLSLSDRLNSMHDVISDSIFRLQWCHKCDIGWHGILLGDALLLLPNNSREIPEYSD